MPWTEWFLPILTFTATSGLLLVLFLRRVGAGRQGTDRDAAADGADAESLIYISPEKAASTRIDRWFYELLEAAGSSLDRATASAVLAAGAILGAAVPLVFFDDILLAMLGTLVGVAFPLAFWKFRAWRRLVAMRKELPAVLELFADAVRSGLSMERAAALAAQETKGPLHTEFRWCAAQLELGHSPRRVMERMAYRIPLPEFRIFATAVLVHRRTGGDLASLADRLARSARERTEFRGHLKAVTAGSRLSVFGLTVGILLAVSVLGLTRPEYIQQFITHPRGPMLLTVAGTLQLVGLLWVWQILRVRY